MSRQDGKDRLANEFKPLLRSAVEAPAKVLGVSAEQLRKSTPVDRAGLFEGSRLATDGEIFTDGDSPEDKSSAMQLYAFLLNDFRQKYGTPQAKPGSV